MLVLDARGLAAYFHDGRADWRPLGEFLRREADPAERIFTENPYTQLCVAYYTVGPRWLSEALDGGTPARSVVSVDGDPFRLSQAWRPGTRAWLVTARDPSPPLEEWARAFPGRPFPSAEGAQLHRLDSARAAPR